MATIILLPWKIVKLEFSGVGFIRKEEVLVVKEELF